MRKLSGRVLSLISLGARQHFAIGVALLAVIPVLSCWYLSTAASGAMAQGGLRVMIAGLLLLVGVTGYLVLRKYPKNIIRLRGYMEHMVRGELPDHVDLLENEDDLAAIETCLNLIVRRMREQVHSMKTEKTHLEEQLYRAQKTESLGLMAGGIAHDFNNLIAGMMCQTDLAMEKLAEEDPAEEHVRTVQKAIKQASELTNQLLIYAGERQIVRSSVQLTELINGMKDLLKVPVKRSMRQIYVMSDSLPRIDADATQVRQVVLNLVMNAADAIGSNQGSIKISTGVRDLSDDDTVGDVLVGIMATGRYVYLQVEDSGCGMDEADRRKIADPFFSTKTGGRGLGLAVVAGIVRGHGGILAVESEAGHGSIFRVLLPVTDVPVPEPTAVSL
jgi:signal transduction histidine kinase